MIRIIKKFSVRIILIILVIGVVAFLVFNQNGLIKYLNLRSEIDQLDSQIKSSEEKIKKLNQEIDSLNTSRDKIERVAREKYHMMKSNERVLKIEEN
mgnify:CR=1 FL=1